MTKRERSQIRLGRVELQIMNVVWEKGTATVYDVKEALSRGRKPAYSTILTMMRKLEDKGYLEHEVHERTYVYQPTISGKEVRHSMLGDVLDQAMTRRPFPLKTTLVGIWLYGTILMLVRLFLGWYRLRRICLWAEPISENSRLRSSNDRKLSILLTSQVDGPVCFGMWRPVILLPREMYNNSSSDDLQMALSHELAHIERRDCRINLLQRVIEAIFFFHPFVWYASLQLTQQREQICDNYVIHKGARIMDYTKLLSRIAEQGFEKTRFQAVALFEGRLLQRVRSLLDPKRSHQIQASRWGTMAGAAMLIVCLIFGAVRLEAKPNVVKDSVEPQNEITRGNPESRPKGNCSISGKVISAETDKPVGYAIVCLSMKAHDSIFIEVASDGTFVFKDIPTGPFLLRTMNTAGFQDVNYNPENRPGRYPRFSLKDKEQRTDVVLKVEPAWSITGKILDENGTPIETDRSALGSAWNPNPSKEFTSYTGAPNRYSAKGLTYTSFFTGEGDYYEEDMIFTTPSSFIIEGMIPGKTILHFYPRTEGRTVKQILYKGENIMETGLTTKSGQEIKEITIVIGAS